LIIKTPKQNNPVLFQAFEREVDAHRAVVHPSILSLHDVDVVTKGTYKEARMLVTYYKVN